jgi:hypothetical protein
MSNTCGDNNHCYAIQPSDEFVLLFIVNTSAYEETEETKHPINLQNSTYLPIHRRDPVPGVHEVEHHPEPVAHPQVPIQQPSPGSAAIFSCSCGLIAVFVGAADIATQVILLVFSRVRWNNFTMLGRGRRKTPTPTLDQPQHRGPLSNRLYYILSAAAPAIAVPCTGIT